MSLTDESALGLIDNLQISSDTNQGKFSLPTESFQIDLNGLPTSIVLTSFSNRSLVIVTQTGKPGSLFEVKRKDSCVEVVVLLGPDSEELHFAGRALGEELSLTKPTLFALGLSSPPTPEIVSEIVSKLKPILA